MNERRTLLRRGAALLLALGAAGLSGLSASCSQTPPNNPVRTFERPEQLVPVRLLALEVGHVEGGGRLTSYTYQGVARNG